MNIFFLGSIFEPYFLEPVEPWYGEGDSDFLWATKYDKPIGHMEYFTCL
jgi:hypothetical protein